MGDTQDGSSLAAQGALSDHTGEEPAQIGARPGFFSRVFGARRYEVPEIAERQTQTTTVTDPAKGLLALRRLRVDDVAIPRAEISAVSNDIVQDDLVARFRESGLTRLPVYDGTLDQPLGMVHLKDLALRYGFNGGGDAFDLASMMRPLIYCPPSMPIGVLLQKMQTERRHMALVIDEYGGVDGLVTIEDLLEQVVGEIEDEHDQDEGKFWRLEAPGCYLVLARAPLDEFGAEVGLSLVDDADDEEVDTLGGLVFVLAGRVPLRGEIVPHPSGIEIEVVDADPRKIKRLRVRVPDAMAKAAE